MIADTDHRLFFRSTFEYNSEEQRCRVFAWLESLPGKVYVRKNRYADRSLVCDFERAAERDHFDEARPTF
jgi:hypothetical protein